MKYKVGDKVRVKSLEWYNENKNECGHVKCNSAIFTENMKVYCDKEVTIDGYGINNIYTILEDNARHNWTDNMFVGLAESELNEPQYNEQTFKAVDDVDYVKPVVFENIVFPNENYADKVELCLGDDYEIVVEDGKTFVQRKKQYPKTYEECCRVLNVWYKDDVAYIAGYQNKLLSNFQKLLICRDAYWKLADNWKPNWNNYADYVYTIKYNGTHIRLYNYTQEYAILAFPTEEMRDAFFENFKDLIESCKELL